MEKIFQEKITALQQEIYRQIVKDKEASAKAFSDYKLENVGSMNDIKEAINNDMTEMKVEIGKSAMIRSLIVTVIIGIIMCAVAYFMNKV